MTPIEPIVIDTLKLYVSLLDQGQRQLLLNEEKPRSIFRPENFIEAALFMADELRNPPPVPDARTAEGHQLTCIEPLVIRLGVEVEDVPRVIRFFHYDGLAYPMN